MQQSFRFSCRICILQIPLWVFCSQWVYCTFKRCYQLVRYKQLAVIVFRTNVKIFAFNSQRRCDLYFLNRPNCGFDIMSNAPGWWHHAACRPPFESPSKHKTQVSFKGTLCEPVCVSMLFPIRAHITKPSSQGHKLMHIIDYALHWRKLSRIKPN